MSDQDEHKTDDQRTSLGELARVFLRLGATAFGGPAAHIALFEAEAVKRRKWLTPERFIDLLGAVNLIPGPNSTEMAIHIGQERRGLPGLVVAGLCFLLPGALLTAWFAYAYVAFGTLPALGAVLYGVKPVILAVVLVALWRLVPKALKTWELRGLGAAALVGALLGLHELAVLFGAGGVYGVFKMGRRAAPGVVLAAALPSAAVAASTVTVGGLFGVFLKAGALLFGSGYVLIAYLRADLVARLGWLTEGQLIDAIAVGQLTPGPLFTTSTFIGFVLAGAVGAVVATVGIFFPAFVLVAVSHRLIPKLRRYPLTSAFLDGVNAASLGLMVMVSAQLGLAAVMDWLSAALFAASLLLMLRAVRPTWLIVGGAAIGWISTLLGA